jgi:hypothetical protein
LGGERGEASHRHGRVSPSRWREAERWGGGSDGEAQVLQRARGVVRHAGGHTVVALQPHPRSVAEYDAFPRNPGLFVCSFGVS